jgi:hypothetical protein
MRTAGIWILPIIGLFLLSGAALAHSPDDEEQGDASEELSPSRSGGAVLAHSSDEDAHSQNYHAPGVHVWVGRHPSKAELQSAITQIRSHAQSLASSVSDIPDFQGEFVTLYMGRLPKPESLWNIRKSSGGGR